MANLPDYVKMATPNPMENRVSWWKSTAQTYAGIMLWFVFWQDIPGGRVVNGVCQLPGGMLSQGIGVALMALVLAAFLCHLLMYVVPATLGMKTGLPLYIVGTSTYGVKGGFLMPGFLMGVLQFGWLSVNAYFSGMLLAGVINNPDLAANSSLHLGISVVYAICAAFIGLKGIKYVASVASFLPIIPVVILIVLCVKTFSGVATFDAEKLVSSVPAMEGVSPASTYDIFNILGIYILGFFATAGAAGCDMGAGNRNAKDVQLGGLFGVFGSTVFAGALSLLIVAGAYGAGLVKYTANVAQTPSLMSTIMDASVAQTPSLMSTIMGASVGRIFMGLLVVAAFPSACFCSMIAVNSFKTTMPKVNPYISGGLGTLLALILIVTTAAGSAGAVFSVIGASFGPICGAMMADYFLSGRKWNGPRAGFNMAGWLSWFFGFLVGAFNFIPAAYRGGFDMPCPPLLAFLVGLVLYAVFAKCGLQSATLTEE